MEQNKPGILDIPIELLQEIILKLDVKNVLSCTKVCKQFWFATQRNKIWGKICRRFCDRSTYVIDYVNTVPSTVGSVYSPPQEVQDSYCEWRSVYMQLIGLKKNIFNGIHKKQFVTHLPRDNTVRKLIFQDLMLLFNKQSFELHVWSLRNIPRLVGTIKDILSNVPGNVFFLADNIVIVVQGTVLQGFKINSESGDITRMYRRLVNDNNNSDIPETENMENLYKSQRRPQYGLRCITGKYFICVLWFGDQSMLYLWNIETGEKVFESNIWSMLKIVTDYPDVNLIAPATYSGDILVVIYKKTPKVIWSVYKFNVKSFIVELVLADSDRYTPAIHFENNKIVIIKRVHSSVLTLYNLKPRSIDTPSRIIYYYDITFQFVDFRMLSNIISYISQSKLTIKDNQFTDLYEVSLLKRNIKIPSTYRILSDWNIVLISFFDRSQGIALIELHDFITKSCINTFDCDGLVVSVCLPINLVVENFTDDQVNINVLQFW